MRPGGRRLRAATVGSGAVVLALLVAGAPGGTTAAAGPSPEAHRSRAAHPAIAADSLADSVGLGVHLSYNDTPYRQVADVISALNDLGARHVRDDLRLGRPDQYAALNALGAAGIGSLLITGRPDEAPVQQYVDVIASALTSTEAVEGPNEWDIFGPPGSWPQQDYQRQAQLNSAVRSTPATVGLPVLGPAMAGLGNLYALAQQGSLSAVSNVANVHEYSNGTSVTGALGEVRAVISQLQPGVPVVVTETGYHDATAATGGQVPVPPDVKATYVPRLFAENLAGGVSRTYLYELVDEFDNPGLDNPEAHFGLVGHHFERKPAFLALRTLIRLTEDPGGSFTPGQLRYDLRGPSDLRSLLMEKRNGQFVLALWRDVSVFDTGSRTRVPVPAAKVKLRFAQRQQVRVYRPTTGSNPFVDQRSKRLKLAVGGDLVVVTTGSPRHDMRRPIRPDPPSDLRAKALRGGARISWHTGAYTTAAGWQVRVGTEVVRVGGAKHHVVVTGLRNGRSYRVSVRALGVLSSSPTRRTTVRPHG